VVVDQSPLPGTPLGDVSQAELRLGRPAPPPAPIPFATAVGMTGARQ
jgi:hypothetical protein